MLLCYTVDGEIFGRSFQFYTNQCNWLHSECYVHLLNEVCQFSILQVLYEFVFTKIDTDVPFKLYQSFPRTQVPISDDQTMSALQVQGPFVIEFSHDSPDPLSYLCASEVHTLYRVACSYSTHMLPLHMHSKFSIYALVVKFV